MLEVRWEEGKLSHYENCLTLMGVEILLEKLFEKGITKVTVTKFD